MNFDNEQAAISQKYVVCVHVKCRDTGAIAILVYRSKTFKTVKLLQSKRKLLSAVVFLSVNFGSCHNKLKLSSFFFFRLLSVNDLS